MTTVPEPRKVYAISSGSYSDYHIDMIFDTKEAAEGWLAAMRQTADGWPAPYDDYNDVEEYDLLSAGQVPGPKPHPRFTYTIWLTADGAYQEKQFVHAGYDEDLATEKPGASWSYLPEKVEQVLREAPVRTARWVIPPFVVVEGTSDDPDRAIKIARDKATMAQARLRGIG